MSSRQIRSSDHCRYSSKENRSSNQRYSSSLISPGGSHEARFRKYSEKEFQLQKRCKRLNGHNTTWLLECRSSFFPIFLFKNSLNFREISVRILRSDMKNKGSGTAISWLCTGKKAMFKGEGNDVKISMFSVPHTGTTSFKFLCGRKAHLKRCFKMFFGCIQTCPLG